MVAAVGAWPSPVGGDIALAWLSAPAKEALESPIPVEVAAAYEATSRSIATYAVVGGRSIAAALMSLDESDVGHEQEGADPEEEYSALPVMLG